MKAHRWVAGALASIAAAAVFASEEAAPPPAAPAVAERHVAESAPGPSTPDERWSDGATPERAGALLLLAAVALLIVRATRNRD
jgi:hypothetical protein